MLVIKTINIRLGVEFKKHLLLIIIIQEMEFITFNLYVYF